MALSVLLSALLIGSFISTVSPESEDPPVDITLYGWGLLSEYNGIFNATMRINGTISPGGDIVVSANLTFWNATFQRQYLYSLTGKKLTWVFYLGLAENVTRFLGYWDDSNEILVTGVSVYRKNNVECMYVAGLRTVSLPEFWVDVYDFEWSGVRLIYHAWSFLTTYGKS